MARRRSVFPAGASTTTQCLPLVIFVSILTTLRVLGKDDVRVLFQDSAYVMEPPRGHRPVVPEPEIHAVLYITTHFSEVHVRYFHCCWPILVQQSPLIRKLHIIVAATNATAVAPEELDYLEKELFVNNPSYQFITPPNASHLSHCEPFRWKARRNRNQKVSVDYKQCLANYGVSFGWTAVQPYEWMIRLNPDVLIRQSTWFLESMQNTSLDALFIDCGEGTRQIHTDFWMVRPLAVVGTTTTTTSQAPFQTMSKIRNRLNHERTAFHQFVPILEAHRHAWVPDMEPSQGICRARGVRAPVLHDHTSCRTDDDDGVCQDLVGWDVAQ